MFESKHEMTKSNQAVHIPKGYTTTHNIGFPADNFTRFALPFQGTLQLSLTVLLALSHSCLYLVLDEMYHPLRLHSQAIRLMSIVLISLQCTGKRVEKLFAKSHSMLITHTLKFLRVLGATHNVPS